MENESNYSPNHIPKGERIRCLVFSFVLIFYGGVGVFYNDLFLPRNRGYGGVVFSGIPAWLMYAAFIVAAANLISVVADHYDKRNNETNYKRFAVITRRIGWALAIAAILLEIFFFHQAVEIR